MVNIYSLRNRYTDSNTKSNDTKGSITKRKRNYFTRSFVEKVPSTNQINKATLECSVHLRKLNISNNRYNSDKESDSSRSQNQSAASQISLKSNLSTRSQSLNMIQPSFTDEKLEKLVTLIRSSPMKKKEINSKEKYSHSENEDPKNINESKKSPFSKIQQNKQQDSTNYMLIFDTEINASREISIEKNNKTKKDTNHTDQYQNIRKSSRETNNLFSSSISIQKNQLMRSKTEESISLKNGDFFSSKSSDKYPKSLMATAPNSNSVISSMNRNQSHPSENDGSSEFPQNIENDNFLTLESENESSIENFQKDVFPKCATSPRTPTVPNYKLIYDTEIEASTARTSISSSINEQIKSTPNNNCKDLKRKLKTKECFVKLIRLNENELDKQCTSHHTTPPSFVIQTKNREENELDKQCTSHHTTPPSLVIQTKNREENELDKQCTSHHTKPSSLVIQTKNREENELDKQCTSHHTTPPNSIIINQTKKQEENKCDVCQLAFINEKFYRKHVDKFLKRLECCKCLREFSNSTKLERHREQHIQKKFNCELCGLVFKSFDSLKVHKLTHSGLFLKI